MNTNKEIINFLNKNNIQFKNIEYSGKGGINFSISNLERVENCDIYIVNLKNKITLPADNFYFEIEIDYIRLKVDYNGKIYTDSTFARLCEYYK